jgi:hypothetical protein
MATTAKLTPEKALAGFMAKYTPAIAREARAVRKKMRARLPGAVELVYDNYNWLVIGFGPNERPSKALFSIVLAPQWITLCFLQGARLRDPGGRLKGSGNQVRNIRLEGAHTLDEPGVEALIAQALELSPIPIDASVPGKLIIKSVSAKQRPRRPT